LRACTPGRGTSRRIAPSACSTQRRAIDPLKKVHERRRVAWLAREPPVQHLVVQAQAQATSQNAQHRATAGVVQRPQCVLRAHREARNQIGQRDAEFRRRCSRREQYPRVCRFGAVVEIEQRAFGLAVAGDRLRVIDREQIFGFETRDRFGTRRRQLRQRHVARGMIRFHRGAAGADQQMALAGPGGTVQIQPRRAAVHSLGNALQRGHIGAGPEGVEALVRRPAQVERKLPDHGSGGVSGGFGGTSSTSSIGARAVDMIFGASRPANSVLAS